MFEGKFGLPGNVQIPGKQLLFVHIYRAVITYTNTSTTGFTEEPACAKYCPNITYKQVDNNCFYLLNSNKLF